MTSVEEVAPEAPEGDDEEEEEAKIQYQVTLTCEPKKK